MSKLTAKQRAALPDSAYAGPGRSFPIPDRNHARAAIQMAPRSEHAGNISHAQAEAIEARARSKLRSVRA